MISAEMDKSRDVRRGTSRFKQQQSRTKLLLGCSIGGAANANGGDLVCLEKAKKEKIRRLSSVNGNRGSHSPCPDSNQHCETEMDSSCRCDLSSDNRENQCPPHSQHPPNSTKKSKIPTKFSDDCDAVDHLSVPRKLRSAMKKRGRDSISPPLSDSEKLNHIVGGVESHKKDGVKKSKLNLKQGNSDCSKKCIVYGPITKDEEEVVETLYAMAGMFSDSDSMDKNKLNGESVEVKSSIPPKTVDIPITEIEVKKEDPNSICCQQAAKNDHPSTIDESSKDSALLTSLNKPTTGDQLDLPGSQKSHMEAHFSVSEMALNPTIPLLAKSEPGAEKSSSVPSDFNLFSELSLETRFKLPKHVTTLLEKKPELAYGVNYVESSTAEQHMMKEPIKTGLGLWPGLSSAVPFGAHSPSSSRSSTVKIPAWLDAAKSGTKPSSLEEGCSTEKASKVAMDRRSMKRCTAHVYISCLIRNLQMQDSKERALDPSLELKTHVGLKRTALLDPNNGSQLRNGIKCAIPISSAGNSGTGGISYEARNAILRQNMTHQDQSHVTSASGMHSPQSIDFLSLSAGGITKEANNGTNKAGTGIESLPQLHAPYLQSFPQQQSLMPFTIPSTRYTSTTYADQISAATVAQQIQLQPQIQYLSNPFCGPPYTSHSVAAAKQQQQLWAAHLAAAQYRPGGSSRVLNQFPNWQNGKPETSKVMHCAQTIIPPHSTVDIAGHKYNTGQHHQPIVTIPSSSPSARIKRQDHHLPSLYEESSVGFRGGGQQQLQLLCNERL